MTNIIGASDNRTGQNLRVSALGWVLPVVLLSKQAHSGLLFCERCSVIRRAQQLCSLSTNAVYQLMHRSPRTCAWSSTPSPSGSMHYLPSQDSEALNKLFPALGGSNLRCCRCWEWAVRTCIYWVGPGVPLHSKAAESWMKSLINIISKLTDGWATHRC